MKQKAAQRVAVCWLRPWWGGIAAVAVGRPEIANAASASPIWRIVDATLGNNSTDATAAIQAEIDAAALLGNGVLKGGIVFVPPGRYKTGTIRLKTGVVLMGAGPATQLVLKTGVAAPLLVVGDSVNRNVSNVVIRDMALVSDAQASTARHGIYIGSDHSGVATPLTGNDCYTLVENVLITDFDGSGVYVGDPATVTPPADVREIRLVNVVVVRCKVNGFDLYCTDSTIIGCTANSGTGIGFNVAKANNRLTNCKGFFNHLEFQILGKRTQLSNCQAQDGLAGGFKINTGGGALSMNISMADCQADTNALFGFDFTNALNCSLSGLTAFLRGGVSATGKAGVIMTGANFCNVSGTVIGFGAPGLGNIVGLTNANGITQVVTG